MQANQQPEMPASVQVLETEAKLSFLAVRCWQDAAWPVAPSTPRPAVSIGNINTLFSLSHQDKERDSRSRPALRVSEI